MTITKTKTRTKVTVAVAVAVAGAAMAAAGFIVLFASFVPIFSLASGSPAGAAVPGFNEVFRYAVTSQRTSIEMTQIMFEVNTTDNGATLWNTCDELGDASKWAIYDNGGNRVDATGGWTFYNSSMRPCSGSEVVAYARTSLPRMSPIPSRSTHVFNVHVDTAGASAVSDDSIVLSIPNLPSAIEWTEGSGTYRGARGVSSLPVVGGTIMY